MADSERFNAYMGRRNVGSAAASASYSSNFSSVGGRNFAYHRWENEIPSKFQTDIRHVALEQSIIPDRRDARYRSTEQSQDFSWKNSESFWLNTEATNPYQGRADRAARWQNQGDQLKGEIWNANFVADSGSRAPRAWVPREANGRAVAESRVFVSKSRDVPFRVEDHRQNDCFPKGRDRDGAPVGAHSQSYASSPGSSSSPRYGRLSISDQRKMSSAKSHAGEDRRWKREERGVAVPQGNKASATYLSNYLQQEKNRDSPNTSQEIGRGELVRISWPGPHCDRRGGLGGRSAVTTSYREISSDTLSRECREVLPMVVYKISMMKLNMEDASFPSINGTCQDMCPATEREMRQRLRDLAVFERLNGDHSKTSRDLAVKKFCRTFNSKDLKQQDVRPFSVLCKTMDHLLKFLNLNDHCFQVVYDFLFDRTRAIRQELQMQRIITKQAVTIHEKLVRFHILSEHTLHDGLSFDSHLNLEQLSKSLITLLDLYTINSEDAKHGEFPHEAEFHCYYVLLNMGNHSGIQVEKLPPWLSGVKPTLLETSEMKFARDVLRCYRLGNFRKFFKLAEQATFLQACLMELYFDEVRIAALFAINHSGYKLHPYPLQELAKLLLLEEEDLEEFCKVQGLLVVESDSSGCLQLQMKRAELRLTSGKKGRSFYTCSTIDNKCASSYLEEVLGRQNRRE